MICDDGIDCTEDRCSEPSGECEAIPNDTFCADANSCTADSCGPTGCTNSPLEDETICDTGVCIDGNCCAGCVDEAGRCQAGDSVIACGSGGVSCGGCPCSSDRCDGVGCPPDYLRAVQLAAGEYHTCARMLGGDIYCWGRNIQGQLGLGDRTPRRRPVRVGSETDWSHIATQHSHTCGIRVRGTRREIHCWGAGTSGQLGNGRSSSLDLPTALDTDRADWDDVATGQFHTCATTRSQLLYCWGGNPSGQLGIPSSTGELTPAPVGEGTSIAGSWRSVSLGSEQTCGVRQAPGATETQLYCWGGGSVGALGLGDFMNRTLPTQLLGTDWAQPFLGYRHSCATLTPGQVACWGLNRSGEAARPPSETFVTMPIGADASTDWRSISLNGAAPPFSGGNTCGVKSDGTLWCWGEASGGRLGMGPGAITDLSRPTRVGDSNDWFSVAVGARHSCALKRDGTVWCWGDGSGYQLGLGDGRPRNTPTRVCFPE